MHDMYFLCPMCVYMSKSMHTRAINTHTHIAIYLSMAMRISRRHACGMRACRYVSTHMYVCMYVRKFDIRLIGGWMGAEQADSEMDRDINR